MKHFFLFVLLLTAVLSRADEESLLTILERMEAISKPSTGNAPRVGLQLRQVIELATMHDARLAPYASTLRLAQLRNEAFIPPDNPQLRLGTGLESDPDLSASIRFFPRNPWALNAQKGENRALVAKEEAAYRQALLETTLQVVSEYHELQCLEKEEELHGRLAVIRQEYADRVEQQLSASVGTQVDGLLARWDVQEALDNQLNLKIKVEQLKHTLVVLTGHSMETFRIAPLEDEVSFALLGAELSIQSAREQCSTLQLLRAKRLAAEARLRGTKAAGIPWVDHLEVGYRNKDRGWQLEAAVNLPFYTLGGTEKMLAYEEVSLRDIEIETQEQMIRIHVEAAVKTYNHAVGEWTRMQQRKAPLVQKTRDYLARVADTDPQRMAERIVLEEKLIAAEFKMLNLRRRIYQAQRVMMDSLGEGGSSSFSGQPRTEF